MMAARKTIDSYPWPAPTQEQMRMFDALSYKEQLKMLQATLIEGEASGISDKSFDEIIEDTRSKIQVKSTKK